MTTTGVKRKPSLNFCQNISLASRLSLEQDQFPNNSQFLATGLISKVNFTEMGKKHQSLFMPAVRCIVSVYVRIQKIITATTG